MLSVIVTPAFGASTSFCVGAHLQHTTAGHWQASSMNSYSYVTDVCAIKVSFKKIQIQPQCFGALRTMYNISPTCNISRFC
uniref:Uncharacterized protein n=1 Tax=Accipiter nisus TaxID=211598 RepID=A0A8B9LYA5_9AVES